MEGTPFASEKKSEDEEERKSRVKKPETFGILAVEQPSEKAMAATRRPKHEEEEKPATEVEPVVIPEATPIERVPEEQARSIVREMVVTEQEPETPEEPAEAAPEPAVEEEPAEEPIVKTVEKAPVKVPEAPAVEVPAVEAPEEPPKPVEKVVQKIVEEEPAEEPAAEAPVEPVVEAAPRPEPEAEPVAVEEPAEKPPAEDDDKKPGFIRSLFKRRDKTEEAAPAETPEEPEVPEPAAAPESAAVEEEKPKAPEFRFNAKIEEAAEEPEAAAEEAEEPRAPEAKPERIGQVVLGSEAAPAEKPELVREATLSARAAEEKMKVESSPIEPGSGKRVDTLNREELMRLGETIEINGSNLRQIYETHLIGERGLRRLIAEYLQGADLPKALRREVMEHEIDFERDPIMRDLAPTAAAPVITNQSAALDKLLEQTGVTMADNGEQTAVFKAQARHEAAKRQHHSHQRRLVDAALAAVITLLIVLIIIIYLIRN